jgi:hypothetical protein
MYVHMCVCVRVCVCATRAHMRAHADILSLSLSLSFSLSTVLEYTKRAGGQSRIKEGENRWRRARIIFLKELESSGLSGMLILSVEKFWTVSALVYFL